MDNFDFKKYLAEGRLLKESMGSQPKEEFEALESIGTYINPTTGMLYAMYQDGTYDPESEVDIMDADHYEIQDQISDEDNEIYMSVLKAFQK